MAERRGRGWEGREGKEEEEGEGKARRGRRALSAERTGAAWKAHSARRRRTSDSQSPVQNHTDIISTPLPFSPSMFNNPLSSFLVFCLCALLVSPSSTMLKAPTTCTPYALYLALRPRMGVPKRWAVPMAGQCTRTIDCLLSLSRLSLSIPLQPISFSRFNFAPCTI